MVKDIKIKGGKRKSSNIMRVKRIKGGLKVSILMEGKILKFQVDYDEESGEIYLSGKNPEGKLVVISS